MKNIPEASAQPIAAPAHPGTDSDHDQADSDHFGAGHHPSPAQPTPAAHQSHVPQRPQQQGAHDQLS
jgi:hypothetical protein